MPDGFIKAKEILEETSKQNDLLDFSQPSSQLATRIDTLDGAFVLALVGPYGSGKSTMLNRIMSGRDDRDEHWVEFDAWKYPDRKDLWEGFVLELAKSISPEAFEEATEKVDGKENSELMGLMSLLAKFTGLAVLEGLNSFLESSPARRVDDIHNILTEQISSLDKDLFIIVEDIDRSGDAGIFFLETLKQFLRDTNFSKKVAVIVPIANDNYHKHIYSYLKCIDYFEFFELNEVRFDYFVDAAFDPTLFKGTFALPFNREIRWTGACRKTQVISFLEELYCFHSSVTMRLIKLILRKGDLVYRNQVADGHNPDFRVTLCIEASKYVRVGPSSEKTFFEEFIEDKGIHAGNIFGSFLYTMFLDRELIYEINTYGERVLRTHSNSFKFVSRKPTSGTSSIPSIPYSFRTSYEESGLGIPDFYIKY